MSSEEALNRRVTSLICEAQRREDEGDLRRAAEAYEALGRTESGLALALPRGEERSIALRGAIRAWTRAAEIRASLPPTDVPAWIWLACLALPLAALGIAVLARLVLK